MSATIFDKEEFDRWIKSAIKTLESAQHDYVNEDYNWACFKLHQAVEKALKALLWGVGIPRTGHSLPKLLGYINEVGKINVPNNIKEACIILNKFYIPTRYPNAWSEGIPEEYYSKSETENAVKLTKKVINWVENVWKRLLSGV